MDPAGKLKMKTKIWERLKTLEDGILEYISRTTVETIQSDVENTYLHSSEDVHSGLKKPTDMMLDSTKKN